MQWPSRTKSLKDVAKSLSDLGPTQSLVQGPHLGTESPETPQTLTLREVLHCWQPQVTAYFPITPANG